MNPAGNPLAFEIHAITRHLDLDSFDCGVFELNEYLRKYARQNHERNIGKTFVAQMKSDAGSPMEPAQPKRVPPLSGTGRFGASVRAAGKVLGFYTAVSSEIDSQMLPHPHSKGLPRYPAPAVRVGRLAVDKRHQGRGIGVALLVDALQRAERLSNEVGIYGVVVDAKDDQAVRFYQKYGFHPLSNKPQTLFLAIKTIQGKFPNR